MNSVDQYYDRYWSDGVSGWRPAAGLSPLMANLLAGEVQAKDVLDYGGGDGQRYGRLVRSAAQSYTVADISSKVLDLRAKEAGTKVMHIEELEGCGIQFDVVLLLEVLEHLLDPVSALRVVRRVLRPGGSAIVSVPNAFSVWNRVRMVAGRMPASGVGAPGVVGHTYDAPHVKFFDLASLRHLIELVGLRCDQVHTEGLDVMPRLPALIHPRAKMWNVTQRVAPFVAGFIVVCRLPRE